MALACAQKIQPYGTCTSGANAVRPHEMRAQNGATSSPGAHNITISWHVIDERKQLVHSTLRHLHLAPLSIALFCIGTRTTRTLSHPLPAKHGLLTERFSKPNVRFASATHAYALHAHSKLRCYGRRGRGKGRELVRLSTPLQKLPVRNLALHVMPRQRLYPNDFGQITIFAWSLAGIS